MSSIPARDALVLTFLGGALGTAARFALAGIMGSTQGLSAGVVMANVAGAGALGYLLARLTTSSLSALRSQRLNLFLGVGVLGGFTTYSTLAVHGAELLADGHAWTAVWHVAAQVVLGVVAAVLGLLAGDRSGAAQAAARARTGERR